MKKIDIKLKDLKLNIDIVKILRKNTSLAILVAIVLAAVILLAFTFILKDRVSKKLQESIQLASQLDSAIRTTLPNRQLELIKEYEDKHQQDANEIIKLAMETTQRPLLSYKIFPQPAETSVQIFNEFKRAYTRAFENLIKDMNGLDAPTEIEIRQAAGSIEEGEMSTNDGGAGRKSSRDSLERITNLLCEKRSKQISCYANPQALGGYTFWDRWEYKGADSAVVDCWFCQLAYWIHQDVIETIKKVNAGSGSVPDSSVKRLLGVYFSTSSRTDRGSADLPKYVMQDLKDALYQPWTGRISNDQIDVVHFTISVIIRANDVLKFMNELCSEKTHYFTGYDNQEPQRQLKHNQITILQSSISPVDITDRSHQRYRYGSDAIVNLDMVCEYIFYKQGYDPIEPNSVKSLTGTTTNAQQQPQQPYF